MTHDTHKTAPFSLRRIIVAAALLGALVVPAVVGAEPGDGPPSDLLASELAAGHGNGYGNGHGPDGNGPPGAGGKAGTSQNLTWHNGPVMHSNTTYLVFWGSMPPGYEGTIVQYFKDVAADSHNSATQNTNVYSTDPQYTDATGRANYDSTYGGVYDSSDAIPDHCSSQYGGLASKLAGCVVDSDLQTEIGKAMTSLGSGGGSTNMYFVFTPPNVGSCSGGSCAYTAYCAYHWYFPQVNSASNVIYANQPYPDPTGISSTLTGSCDSGQQPNSNWADSTINVASHEHNEAVTDPYGTGWYQGNYNEDGDKCAWGFGTALGGSSGAQWNQVINGNHYFLQREWDNASSSCVQRVTPPPPPPPAAPSGIAFTPGGGAPGQAVTITGANFTGTTSVKFNGTSATFTFVNDGQITATVPSGATTGPVTVTNSGGTGTSSPTNFTVTVPDFSILVTEPSQTVHRGSSVQYHITITRLNGFTGTVSLSLAGLPGGKGAPTASFSPSSISNPGTTSTLTVTTRSNSSTGSRTLTVTGTSGSLRHSASTGLTIS